MSEYRQKSAVLSIVIIVILMSLPIISQCSIDLDYAIWSKAFGGRNYDAGESIIEVEGGGLAISGRTQGFDLLPFDDQAWLVRCDLDGNHLWNKTYGGGLTYGGFMTYFTHSVTVIQSPDGGFLLTSHTTNYGPGDVNGWLIHTDQNGNCLWNYTYGSTMNEILVESVACREGGYLSVGFTENISTAAFDGWVLRTDAYGNHLWNKTYGYTDVEELFYDVVELEGGGYVMTGGMGEFSYFGDFNSREQDGWLCCINEDGTQIWNQTYGGPNIERLDQIIQCANGDLAVCGRTMSYGMGEFDTWLIRTDSNGQILWNKTYGIKDREVGFGLEECQDGGFAIFSLTFNVANSTADGWFIRTDSLGDSLWEPFYGGSDFDQFWGGVSTNDGFVAVGITQSFGSGMVDMWITKIPEIIEPPPIDVVLILFVFGSSVSVIVILAIVLLKDKDSK